MTVPLPVPFLLTDRVWLPDELKVAVTDRAEFMVTVHVPKPEQAPLQPAKVEGETGVAVSVTIVL